MFVLIIDVTSKNTPFPERYNYLFDPLYIIRVHYHNSVLNNDILIMTPNIVVNILFFTYIFNPCYHIYSY